MFVSFGIRRILENSGMKIWDISTYPVALEPSNDQRLSRINSIIRRLVQEQDQTFGFDGSHLDPDLRHILTSKATTTTKYNLHCKILISVAYHSNPTRSLTGIRVQSGERDAYDMSIIQSQVDERLNQAVTTGELDQNIGYCLDTINNAPSDEFSSAGRNKFSAVSVNEVKNSIGLKVGVFNSTSQPPDNGYTLIYPTETDDGGSDDGDNGKEKRPPPGGGGGAIALGVVFALLGFAIIAFILFYYYRKRRRARYDPNMPRTLLDQVVMSPLHTNFDLESTSSSSHGITTGRTDSIPDSKPSGYGGSRGYGRIDDHDDEGHNFITFYDTPL
jgi:hypothetical protein